LRERAAEVARVRQQLTAVRRTVSHAAAASRVGWASIGESVARQLQRPMDDSDDGTAWSGAANDPTAIQAVAAIGRRS